MNGDFKLEGLDDLVKAFAELGEDAFEELAPKATEAANIVLVRASSRIRNRTGNLAKSLKVTRPSRKQVKEGRIFALVRIGKGAAYGVPLELGHRLWMFGRKTNRDVEQKPFLRPAADESHNEVRSLIAEGMNKILDEWGDK